MNCPICQTPLRIHDNLPDGETCCRACRERVMGLDKTYPEAGWIIVIPARNVRRLLINESPADLE